MKFSAKKACFRSFQWEKWNFTTFDHPKQIFWLPRTVFPPNWKKSFRRPCWPCIFHWQRVPFKPSYGYVMGIRRGRQKGHLHPPWKLGLRTKIF